MTFDERERLIALSRERTAVAKDRFEAATKRTKELVLDLRTGEAPSPDAALALRQAHYEERALQHEYFKAMKICSDLLLHRNPKKQGF